jgi:outer membrane protein OmpA-like peptidoglycan-associated protein
MRWLLRPSRLFAIALIFIVGYSLIGFFLLPYVIKAFVLPAISERLHRPVLVKEVELNPFALSLRVTGFEIRESDQSALLGFDEFVVNFQAVSLIRRAYVFDAIRFTMPFVSVKVSKDGRVNLKQLVPPDDMPEASQVPRTPEAPAEIPAVQIEHFEIAQGIVEFRDESKAKPISIDIVPVGIVLRKFHTKPGGDNAYAFTAELGKGETLDWEGTISLEPIRSEGKLSLSGVKLPTLWQYLQDQFNFDIPSGTIQAKGQYRFETASPRMNVQVSDASLYLADITVLEKGEGDPVITVPSLKINGIQFDLSERKTSIESIVVADTIWNTWLNPDGTVNYQALFAPVEPELSSAPPAASVVATASVQTAQKDSWSLAVKEARVTNHTIHFQDRSLHIPMRADITGLSINTHDLAVPIKGPLPLDVELTLNESGKMKVEGQVTVEPFQTDLTIGMKNIAIQPFQPYLEQFARIAVDSGAIDLDGQVHVALKHPKAPLLTFQGNLGVKALAIADRDQGSPVASWKQLQLRQLALAVDPTTVTIDEVGLEQPTVHLAVHPDGQLNLTSLFPQADVASSPPAAEKAAPSTKKPTPPSIAIKTVKLLRGTATFQDKSITPTVQAGLHDLTGTIKGLSSKQLARADVDLTGRVDKVAPLKIIGTINPLSEEAFTDLAITFENMDLTTGGPYSGKYVGYGLSKGKLFLNLKYKVSQKQLEAENSVVVDQLTFGEKTNSPDATSLPVPLAVALLKDRKGRIEIDLPIRGDLGDPDFKYGKVVLSTLLNLLTKIVASPFTLMGKLIPGGGDGEELQFIEFQPGSVAVASEETKKIDALAKALEERPGLRLDITGTADPTRDREALRENKLNEQLRSMRQRERGKTAAKDEPLSIDDEQRLVTELYEQRRNQLVASAPPQPAGVLQKPPLIEEMKHQLAASLPLDETELRTLARQRAEQVRDQLIEAGKLAEERVFLQEIDPTASGNEKVRSRLRITAGS